MMNLAYMKEYAALRKEMQSREIANMNFSDLKKHKTSDTVYILGSGATINDITPEQWEHIFKHDTISFNFFLVHPIVTEKNFPKFHFMEFPLKGRENQLSLLASVLQHHASFFAKNKTPFLPRFRRFRESGLDISYFPEAMREQVQLCLPHLFSCRSADDMDSILKKLDTLWKVFGSITLSPFVYHAGSISYTTMFAYLLGYKKIVLLGVDLNNPKYFWDEEDHPFYEQCRDIRSSVFKDHTSHVTANPEVLAQWGQLPVQTFLKSANETLFKKRGVKLCVGSSKSLLAESLPVEQF